MARAVQAYDYYSEVVAEAYEWMQEMIEFAVDAIVDEHGRAPFEPPATKEEKKAILSDMLWLPDGSPNDAEREELMKTVGPEGFEKAVVTLVKERGVQP